jgi:DNA processing protein
MFDPREDSTAMSTTFTSVIDTIADNTTYTPDTIARIVWSAISTPGDANVGTLVAELGAAAALEATMHGTSPRIAGVDMTGLRTKARSVSFQTALEDPLRWAAAPHHGVLTPTNPMWPSGIAELGSSAPLALWIDGDQRLLSEPTIAVTGDRDATAYGNHVCIDLATTLADHGYVIVSTDQKGIDTVALQSSLARNGCPIAVRCGHEDQSNDRGILDDVAVAGCVVDEVPPVVHSRTRMGSRRSMLVGALAAKTVVVEARLGSPALRTAEEAADLRRPVGAVPGPVTSAASVGCHWLMRHRNAVPIATAEDVEVL